VSDLLTAVGTVGTVVAGGLAAWSIRLSTRQAKANAEATASGASTSTSSAFRS
jgi:hypothetical protein